MAVMFYIANFGTACYAQTATATAMRNFPAADRGKVILFFGETFRENPAWMWSYSCQARPCPAAALIWLTYS